MGTLELAQGSCPGVTLDAWVHAHGPLGASPALLIALDICIQASRLADAELARVVGSLTTTAIARDPSGRWSWSPAPDQPISRRVRETDVLERVGAILFHTLTGRPLGYPLPVELALRTQLRGYRPDLPAAVADLTIDAVSAPRRGNLTLASFCRHVLQTLGTERPRRGTRSHQARAALASSALLAVLIVWLAARGGEQVGSHGLTPRESVLLDVLTERTQSLAMMNEHTAAIQVHQQLSQLWLSRVTTEDPRVAWNEAHHAWVRTLAGDRLTAEQSLENMPASLAASVGEHHPYTRASRLALAATLAARGATAEASALRMQAARSVHQLLHGIDSEVVEDDPVPPGVIAHVAPNAPEREGFRRLLNGNFAAPLTSVQRWIASRNGWRLHIVADGPCQASFVAGADPRRIVVNATRDAGRSWQVRVEGATPAATLQAPQGETVHISLSSSGTDALDVAVAQQHVTLGKEPSAERPAPPYTLTFRDAPDRRGCSVVWLEIPFPPETTFTRR